MSDFYILNPPTENNTGWYISAYNIQSMIVGWLGHDGKLTLVTDDLPSLYYKTEMDAHEAGYAYYEKHGEVYPYASKGFTFSNVGDDIESQVMEFE